MASITPLGAVTYVNQNTQSNAIRQANAQEKIDFAAVVNQELMNQEDQKIKEVRPAEATEKVNPDEKRQYEEDEEEEEEEDDYEEDEEEIEYEEYEYEEEEIEYEEEIEEDFEDIQEERQPLDFQV